MEKGAAANHGTRVGRPRRRAWTPIERDAGLPLAKGDRVALGVCPPVRGRPVCRERAPCPPPSVGRSWRAAPDESAASERGPCPPVRAGGSLRRDGGGAPEQGARERARVSPSPRVGGRRRRVTELGRSRQGSVRERERCGVVFGSP